MAFDLTGSDGLQSAKLYLIAATAEQLRAGVGHQITLSTSRLRIVTVGVALIRPCKRPTSLKERERGRLFLATLGMLGDSSLARNLRRSDRSKSASVRRLRFAAR